MTIRALLLCLTCALPQAYANPSPQQQHPLRWETATGARVVFYPAMEVPMLNVSVAFAAGSAYDGEQFGLSALTTRLLNQGNGGLDASIMADQLAQTGAQYDGDNNQNMVVLSLKTLTTPEPLNQAIKHLSLIISHPDFPEIAFAREKNQQGMVIAQAQESPDEVANQTFYKALYQKHPYAHPINGDIEHLRTLSLPQVREFYQHYFVGRNAIIVLVGAIDSPTAHQIAEQLSHDLPMGNPAPAIPKALPLTEELNLEIKFPSTQTMLRIGQLGIDHHNPHYFPLLVGNHILGGGSLVSRLAHELREKRGLTYGAYSQFTPMPGIGPFMISLSTQNKQISTAATLTQTTLDTFIQTGPTDHELTEAKQYLMGSFPLSLASNRSMADILLKMAFYHLPDDYLDTYLDKIKAVTKTDIKEAFQRQIFPHKLLQVTVGNS